MMNHKLPKNWIALKSNTHPDKIYYFNTKTNQSSWEEPSTDQADKVRRKSKKRKTSLEHDGPVEPTTPESSTYEDEIVGRKKLVAKRSLAKGQPEKKANEGMETPQMRAIREKMLKKKEKIHNSKNVTEFVSLNRDSPVSSKSNANTSPKVTYTPQMQVLLEKMEERARKPSSASKKIKQNVENKVQKEAESSKTQLRRQSVNNKKNEPESVPHLLTVEKGKETNKKLGSRVRKKKRSRKSNFIEDVSKKQSLIPLKKNLGKTRMETLRESLTLQDEIAEVVDNNNHEKMSSPYKYPEVRLTRLKDKGSNNNLSINDCSTSASEDVVKHSQESVTSQTKYLNTDSFYEDMDWEPLEDEKITFMVQAVRTQLCAEDSANMSCNIPVRTLENPILLGKQEKEQLYIVVDTNVFLSNIEAIELAREATFKTYDRPHIVIPWTVIRELDYIKDNKGKTKPESICGKARKAINYINRLFSTKQPHIIGQTPEDVARNKIKFSVDCPDDEILQTCLQILDLRKTVVLLSYDVNLCNKAMIYDIVTLGRNDPLEKVDYLNAINYTNDSFSDSTTGNNERYSLESSVILNEEQCLADEIFEDIKCILRDFLTVIVSMEMHVLYGESWEKYVILKPPWTVVTVLQCAVKHWIAAISDSFRRQAIFILKDLLQIFRNAPGKKSLKEDICILDKCSDLIQMACVEKHAVLIPRVSTKIDELKEKCHSYESKILRQKFNDIIGVESDIEEQERRAQKAFHYFEASYVFARDMCGLAAEAVGMPCSFQYNIPNPPPSIQYIKQIQPELAANVNKLLCSLSVAIEEVKNSSTDYLTFINLHQTLTTFIPDNAPMEMKLVNVNLVPLDIYCCITRKQEVLNRGLHQLQELSTHFCKLASYRCV